jgi:hypothetical protein
MLEPTKRTIAKDKATAKDKPTRSSEPSATTTSTAEVDGRIVYVSVTMTPFCKKGETECQLNFLEFRTRGRPQDKIRRLGFTRYKTRDATQFRDVHLPLVTLS